MIGYAACVMFGVIAGLAVLRFVPNDTELPRDAQRKLSLAAICGALLGAFLFELPADLYGWSGAPDHGAVALGGRTVVGGLLGGWIAVELAKVRLRITKPTGDRFAISVAVAMTFGRLGCFFAGCCTSPALDGWLALPALDGTRRIPVPLFESWFHALAAVVLVIATRQRRFAGYRFSIYVTCYAVLRFALEPLRESPPIALGLTYYQWLVLPLAILGGTTWLRRARAGRAPVADTGKPTALGA